MKVWCCCVGKVKQIRTSRLTCDASWEKTASNRKVFGAAAEDRLLAAAESPAADVSQRVSCFFLPSTLRSDMDSEDSLLWTEQIRTITLTCRQTGRTSYKFSWVKPVELWNIIYLSEIMWWKIHAATPGQENGSEPGCHMKGLFQQEEFTLSGHQTKTCCLSCENIKRLTLSLCYNILIVM